MHSAMQQQQNSTGMAKCNSNTLDLDRLFHEGV